MTGRSRVPSIKLTDEEREQLQGWAERRVQRTLALRARIVLDCSSAGSNRQVARALGVTEQTVGKWRERFLAGRVAGLLDKPRSGAPRLISDATVEAVLTKTLHERPPNATRWSSRRLAEVLGISQRAVLRIWRMFDL